MDCKRLLVHIICLSLFSFLLNFVWESLHAVFLYEWHNFEALRYVSMVMYASTMDSVLILSMYAITSAVFWDYAWIKGLNKHNLAVFVSSGLIIAAFIEYRAVFVLHKWAYNSLMPTLFGIGISPLVQLGVTGIVSLYLARKMYS